MISCVSQACRSERSEGGRLRHSQKPDSDTSRIRHEVWTGSPSLAITSIASNRLLGRHRLQQFRGAFGNGKFGFRLGDTTTGSGEFGALDQAQARFLSGVDELLAQASCRSSGR